MGFADKDVVDVEFEVVAFGDDHEAIGGAAWIDGTAAGWAYQGAVVATSIGVVAEEEELSMIVDLEYVELFVMHS